MRTFFWSGHHEVAADYDSQLPGDKVVVMAFECPQCNERNYEVQFAGQFRPNNQR
uniref:Zinc finger ZPR1-type domain-containing protein n=1 Tax=Aegilops tauschii subsp. strangulata TaxID=200361 RepID=A0A453K1I9_AEGTS